MAILIASAVLIGGVGCSNGGRGSQETPPPVQATTTTENPAQVSQSQATATQDQEDAQLEAQAAMDVQTVAQRMQTKTGLDDQLGVVVTAYCNTLDTTDANLTYLGYFEGDLVKLYANKWVSGGRWESRAAGSC